MEVAKVIVDRPRARELYRKYKAHVHYQRPMDAEIQRAYQLIGQGRLVIQALESIRQAGVGTDGYPKLAIARADQAICRVEMWSAGSARFSPDRWPGKSATKNFSLPEGTFPRFTGYKNDGVATTPLIPVHLRPQRGLANYHVLWEAEWTRVPPRDPYLLRRIGGDLWLVVAAWDLTEVERAAMSTRISG